MEITEEKLQNDLKGKVGENNYTERSWNEITKSVKVFVPEKEEDYDKFLDAQASFLKGINGQMNSDIAEKVRANSTSKDSELTKLKKELEELKKKDSKSPEKSTEDETKSQIEELRQQIESLKESNSKKEEKIAISEKKGSLVSKLKEKGCDIDTLLNLIVPQLDINKDSEIDDLVKKGKSLYDHNYKELFGTGYSPLGGSKAIKKPSTESIAKNLESFREKLKQNNTKN